MGSGERIACMVTFTSSEIEITPLGSNHYQVADKETSRLMDEPSLFDMLKNHALSNKRGEPISAEDVIYALNNNRPGDAPIWVSLVKRVA
jgi:hypothetical protein